MKIEEPPEQDDPYKNHAVVNKLRVYKKDKPPNEF